MELSPPRAEVTVYSPLFTPFRQPLHGENVSIGRASECAIPIRDRYLSRKHAEIVAVGGNWILKDCGSVNGTYLNGSRVQKDMRLSSGDRIRLGDTEIVFISAEHTTDRFLAIADTAVKPNIEISVQEIDFASPEPVDATRLQTLNSLARELIEDRPLYELFGFIVERVMEHLQPSRAAVALLGDDGRSFSHVEVRRRDKNDNAELTISHTLLKTVVEEKKALACMDVSVDEKLSMSKSIAMQGIRSILCAPLIIGDKVEGVLYVDYLVAQKSISMEDVRLVAQIARFAAIKLETTRLREEAIEKRVMDEELRTAANIQRRLLPPAPKNVPGYSFVGTNQASRTVSGDYYDFIVRADGHVYFVDRRRQRQRRSRGTDDGRAPGRVPDFREEQSRSGDVRDATQQRPGRDVAAVEIRDAVSGTARYGDRYGRVRERRSYASALGEARRRRRSHRERHPPRHRRHGDVHKPHAATQPRRLPRPLHRRRDRSAQ